MINPAPSILPTLNQADAWLVTNPLGSDPKNGNKNGNKDGEKEKKIGQDLEKVLSNYNNTQAPQACNPLNPANKIVAARSVDRGIVFSQPAPVSTVNAFDQGTTNASFRSTAYPTMAVDDTGRVYVAWTTRGVATSTANPDPAAGDSRIVVATSPGGSAWANWTTARAIDQPKVPGHQIKPSLCFTAGKLFLVYYDFREDVSKVFSQYVVDLATNPARHTVDVRAAMALPGTTPVFTDYSLTVPKASDQMSRYPFVIVGTNEANARGQQLQYNPPNLPIFIGGTAPFFGDYVDVAPSPAFIPNPDGTWSFNTAPSAGAVLQVAWTDNRDVKGPPDGDWTKYVPPTNVNSGGPSKYDPAQTVPPCQTSVDAQRTGMRNQNVYNARVSSGLYVAAPGSYKPLGGIQRTFVIFVQNTTAQEKSFRLQIQAPAGIEASFAQSGSPQLTLDATIAGYSSISRTVFVSPQSQPGSIPVNVFEINQIGGAQVPGGLASSVVLNADPSNPPPPTGSSISTVEIHNPAIMNPAIMNPAIMNPAIMNPAIMNPAIMNPAIMNPAIMNPAIMNPAIMNPAIMNPAIMNPAIMNPAIMNPAVYNPAIMNPAIMNPAIMNPAIMNWAMGGGANDYGTIREANWAVLNTGNTTSAYSFNALLPNTNPDLTYQLMVYRLYMTPVSDGCTLKQEAQQELLVSQINPDLSGSLFRNTQSSANANQPTFYLNPGDYAIITLMAFPNPTSTSSPAQIQANLDSFSSTAVSAGVVAQPVNSDAPPGDPMPATAAMVAPSIPPLSITTGSLPAGTAGQPYGPVTLAASGGYGTQTWSVALGALPSGVTLSGDGVIGGTPTVGGTFNITVRVADYALIATRNLTLTISPMSLAFVTQPSMSTAGQNMALVEVRALDGFSAGVPGVTVTLSIGTSACPGCSLSGNIAITDGTGVAHFSTLQMDKGGWGYTLVASADPVNAASAPFDVIGFCSTGSMATTRASHTATLLPGGKVLVAAGWNGGFLSSAQLYDPATKTWSGTGSMATARDAHTATLLPGGNVLVVGGYNGSYLASAELYDPATGTWSATASMAAARYVHTATLLPSGKVLVAGGTINGSSALSSAELYDPASGTWSGGGSMAIARYAHTATLLPNGKVLVTGGLNENSPGYLSTAELYDPATNTWSATGSMATARYGNNATLLQSGKVLVEGGWNGISGYLSNAELYDPTNGSWSAGGSMANARHVHTATLLPSGQVLVAGGYNPVSGSLAGAELFHPDRTQLYFVTQPNDATARVSMPQVRVRAIDNLGNGISGETIRLKIVPGPCTSCILTGTTTQITDASGNVTFSGIAATKGGWGYRLAAWDSSKGIMTASDPFNVIGACDTGLLAIARYAHTSTMLLNGKVLVAGGSAVTGDPFTSAELYDPLTETWTSTGSLTTARRLHTATLLPDGRVLVVGGEGIGGVPLSSAEIYNPGSGIWSAAGTVGALGVVGHAANLLPDGRVLVSGGYTGMTYLATAAIYNPALGTWNGTGSMSVGRQWHTATLLPNGKVLVAGGYASGSPIASAELFDPTGGSWSGTNPMNVPRRVHTATLLANGKVFVYGYMDGSGMDVAEMYDPGSSTWRSLGYGAVPQFAHTATLLADGKVLLAGGWSGSSPTPTMSMGLYDPASRLS